MFVPSFWVAVVQASISVAIIRLFTVLLSLQITETSSNHINIKCAKSRDYINNNKKHKVSDHSEWSDRFNLRFSRKCIELNLTLSWRLAYHLKSSSKVAGRVNSPWRKLEDSAKISCLIIPVKNVYKNIYIFALEVLQARCREEAITWTVFSTSDSSEHVTWVAWALCILIT